MYSSYIVHDAVNIRSNLETEMTSQLTTPVLSLPPPFSLKSLSGTFHHQLIFRLGQYHDILMKICFYNDIDSVVSKYLLVSMVVTIYTYITTRIFVKSVKLFRVSQMLHKIINSCHRCKLCNIKSFLYSHTVGHCYYDIAFFNAKKRK